MSKRLQKALAGVIVLVIVGIFQHFAQSPTQPATPNPQDTVVLGEQTGQATVTKIIDGDTLDVTLNGKKEKIRVLGINTPETVDPRREVECFGREASMRAKEILLNQSVRLENDISQSDRDRYGRLLRYVFLPQEIDYGLKMIQEGFAYEYTYDNAYKYQAVYKKAQEVASQNKVGLWRDGVCN